MSDFRFENNNELDDEDEEQGLNAGDLGLWAKEPAGGADMYLAAADPPKEPPSGEEKPKETDKPPTPPPTGEAELPKVTDKQREEFYKANKENIDAMVKFLTPDVRNNEYERRTVYNDISNGHGSSRMQNMLKRATETGPEEVAKFLAAVNQALKQNRGTENFSISGDFKVEESGPAKRNTCEFTLKRPGTGLKDDKYKGVGSFDSHPGPRGSRIPQPGDKK
jgi:hypothetical protein